MKTININQFPAAYISESRHFSKSSVIHPAKKSLHFTVETSDNDNVIDFRPEGFKDNAVKLFEGYHAPMSVHEQISEEEEARLDSATKAQPWSIPVSKSDGKQVIWQVYATELDIS